MRDRRSGTEPLTARSPLKLRAALSGVALVLALAGGVFFLVLALEQGDAGYWACAALLAAIVAIAATDLVVLRRHAQREPRSSGM